MAMISHFRYPVYKARGKGFKPYKFLFSGYPVSPLYLTSEILYTPDIYLIIQVKRLYLGP